MAIENSKVSYTQNSHLTMYVVDGKADVCPSYLWNTLGGKVFPTKENYERFILDVNDLCESEHMVETLRNRNENSPSGSGKELKEYVPLWKRLGPLNSNKSEGACKWGPLVQRVDVMTKNSNNTLCTVVCTLCLNEGKGITQSLIGAKQHIVGKGKAAKIGLRWGNIEKHFLRNHNKETDTKLKAEMILNKKQSETLTKLLNGGHKSKIELLHLNMTRLQTKLGYSDASMLDNAWLELLLVATTIPTNLMVPLKREKAKNLKAFRLAEMYFYLEKAIEKASNYMNRGLNPEAQGKRKASAFATALHDGWETKRKKEFGGSISFIDPETWQLIRVAIWAYSY